MTEGVAQAIADDRYYQPRESSWAEMCERLDRECAKNEQDSVRWEAEAFSEAVKRLLGKRYKGVPKELRTSIRKMSKVQERGGPVASAPQEL